MLKNYLLIGLRSLRKHLSYSIINIVGLALGLATCLLLVTWIQHELSYDTFHNNANRIYRSSLEYSFGGQTSKTSVSPTALLPALQKNFAEVENGVRVYNPSGWNPYIVKHEDNLFQEEKFFFADSTFFQVFSFSLLSGNPNNVLTQPNSVVITQTTAQKYFGDKDPVGKTLLVNGRTDYTITGVLEDLPSNSVFQFDFLGSFASLSASKELQWWSANYQTFVLMAPSADLESLHQKTNALVKKEVASELTNPGDYVKYNFTKLPDLYLKSGVDESTPVGNIQYIYIFGAIAILVLAIACINYINLATARASDRAKEVGIRKVVGALRKQLFFQFLSESMIITLISLGVALLLAKLVLPLFNSLTGKNFTSDLFINTPFISLALLAAVVIALLAGAYPAFAITSFKPVSVLKGNFKTSDKGIWLRQSLVVFQFGISIVLIIGTLVITNQLDFMQNKKLGYQKENTVILPLDRKTEEVFTTLRSEILRSGIASSVARATESPTNIQGGYSINLIENNNDRGMIVTAMAIDENFIPALNMELLQGRNVNETDYSRLTSDTTYSFIVNETTVKELMLDLQKSIGTKVSMNGRTGEIVGVVKDFHFAPLQQKIAPVVLFTEEQYSHIFVKLNGSVDISQSMATLKQICATVTPHRPFEFDFLDEEYMHLYQNEQRMRAISTTFATLTIMIACLGLFGLVAFSAAQKTKEIGVRKVMGATVTSIIILITRDFIKLVLIAILLGLPVAYWIMTQWLSDFTYKTDIGIWPVVIASTLSIAIAFGTACFQAVKAALINPVNTLRNE